MLFFQLSNDTKTLNRTAVASSISSAFSIPSLAAAVASSVSSCPEPVDYKMSDFITCLKTSCMNSVSPFMQTPTSPVKSMGPSPSLGSSPFVGSSPYMSFPPKAATSPHVASPPPAAPSSNKSPPSTVEAPAAMGIPPNMVSPYFMQSPPAAAPAVGAWPYAWSSAGMKTLPFTGIPAAVA